MTPDVLTRNPTGRVARRSLRDVSLQDRYELAEGLVHLSGTHALVRALLDQVRADHAAGSRTGAMISGYQGSPLGGFDRELGRVAKLREPLGIHHQPALNEELGATTVWGSQLATALPQPTVDGVLGVWYGKAPGVDRASDALRHGNFSGADPKGGLIALCGDDPATKSSTLPSASESIVAALGMPIVSPGSLQEALDLTRHAIAASRASGLWVAVKVSTNVADASGTALVGLDRVRPVIPMVEFDGGPYVHRPSAEFLAPASVEMERTLHGPRLALAREYARLNGLNRVVNHAPEAWLGIAAHGTAYHDLREALRTLGLGSDAALERAGIRLAHLQMPWPLDAGTIRAFAEGLSEVLVVEDKGPFVETQIREALYECAVRPRVDGGGFHSALDPDAIGRLVGERLLARDVRIESVEARLRLLDSIAPTGVAGAPARTPFFCSGCPHNRSTDAPEDAQVGLGIGCHTMVLLNQAGKGKVTGLTQMGGEGAQWIGQAPFTATPHLFQNLGDGTFHHSGSLAVRAAVAAGVNVTYKLLYNRAVAMTGGQDIEGGMTVPELTRWLEAEGVKRVVVTTEDVGRYEGVSLASIAEVRPRRKLMATQRELASEPGVTVLIHDQICATEKRRAVKRGTLAKPAFRVAINERVCEGCGDCGQKSDCLSVQPVATEFGRKTRIHQASCNTDYSCLDGDCPSFLEVVPGTATKAAIPRVPVVLPEPAPASAPEVTLRMIGIGGTGVVTVAQVVGMAALLDGRHVRGLDQTGLAQKGGPVVSDVRISCEPSDGANRAVAAGVDAYLGFDLLGAASPKNLFTADPSRTVAVVSTHQTPTGSMVVDPDVSFAELSASLDVIERHVGETFAFDAQALSEALFGDHMPANALLLGAAWQKGLVPVSLAAIERAFELNGAAVEQTLAAFAWGRATVAAPDVVEAATRPAEVEAPVPAEARALVESIGGGGAELRRLLEIRVSDLIAYQSVAYATQYVDVVRSVLAAEPDGSTRMTEAVARGLHKLMAYKDEYEVARLHLDPLERARIEAEFGAGATARYKLHPPVLRALGMDRKITVGRAMDPAFRALRRMKRLRGTRLDPFGMARVRRVERALPAEYRALVTRALPFAADAYDLVVELCELPDVVRGYEDIKLAGVERFRSEAAALLARLEAGDYSSSTSSTATKITIRPAKA
ncbi:MAG: indolepyruvate ferredoxin oxidoreductase [Solirubrobacteraceae bacterium]|nr:indolepyruvate ferredoxin oxidoreductase [Solirubrobacteraceae bacterium]